jgi:hypothetical protein
VQTVATATVTKLFKLKPSGRVLFVFSRYIIALLALGALQNYVISRHKFLPFFIYTSNFRLIFNMLKRNF